MSFEHRGNLPLEYDIARYPGSALRFRGPAARFDRPYILCLGGTETFGRFVFTPFPTLLGQGLGRDVINMGVVNGGLDVLMTDPAIRTALDGAEGVVLQIIGAQNMSNRFYSVHPRRNDRFTKASSMLRTIYREVDFTEFHFTRHLLTHLQNRSPDRFGVVRAELEAAWIARLRSFLDRIATPVHLLWLSRRHPRNDSHPAELGPDPLFVTADMLNEVRPHAASLSIVAPEDDAAGAGTRGMFFAAGEAAAARALPGPDLHDLAAARLRALLT